MPERRFPRRSPRHSGAVDVPEPFFLVPDMPLRLEHPQLSAHGRITGVSGEVLHNVGGRGASAPVEDVHDLTLAARQHGVRIRSVGAHDSHATCVTYMLQ